MSEFYEMIRPMLPVYIGGLTVYLVLVIYCILSIVRNPKFDVKKKVHNLVIQSYSSRDESNKLIDEATKIMIDELELQSIEELKKEAFSYSKDINYFSKKLSDFDGRLEGSYHIPLIDVIKNI